MADGSTRHAAADSFLATALTNTRTTLLKSNEDDERAASAARLRTTALAESFGERGAFIFVLSVCHGVGVAHVETCLRCGCGRHVVCARFAVVYSSMGMHECVRAAWVLGPVCVCV